LWSVENDQVQFNLHAAKPVAGAALNHDDSLLIVWTRNHDANVWKVPSGKDQGSLGKISGAFFTKDDKGIVSWTDDRLCYRRTTDLRVLWQSATIDKPLGAQIGPDDRSIVTWNSKGSANLWRFEPIEGQGTPRDSEPIITMRHPDHISGARFGDDGKELLTWGDNGVIRIWDLHSQMPSRRYPHKIGNPTEFMPASFSNKAAPLERLVNPSTAANSATLAWLSPNGRSVISRSLNEAHLWRLDVDSAKFSLGAADGLQGAVCSPDNQIWAVWGNDLRLRLLDAHSGFEYRVIEQPESLELVMWLPDGSGLITWSKSGAIRSWSFHNGQLNWSVAGTGPAQGAAMLKRRIATISRNQLTVRHTLDGATLHEFKAKAPIVGCEFSADGEYLLAWGGSAAEVWNCRWNRHEMTCDFHGNVGGAAFPPGSNDVLVWGRRNPNSNAFAVLWGLGKKAIIRKFESSSVADLHRDQLVFAASGRHFFAFGRSAGIEVWSLEHAAPIGRFARELIVTAVRRGKDGSELIAWSPDGTCSEWEDPSVKKTQAARIDLERRTAVALDSADQLRLRPE
jgi:WD40 repeat protein